MRAPHHQSSWKQYLSIAEASQIKLEYFNGEILAMAGGTPMHAALAARLSGALDRALEGGPCRIFSSDLRIRVPATGLATYPDVTVVCGPLAFDPEDRNTVTNPTLLVEVLSDSTERYDRGAKLEHYQRLASLRELVLVSHRERRLEVVRRGVDGGWTHHEVGGPGSLRLAAFDCTLDVDRIYAGLDLDI